MKIVLPLLFWLQGMSVAANCNLVLQELPRSLHVRHFLRYLAIIKSQSHLRYVQRARDHSTQPWSH